MDVIRDRLRYFFSDSLIGEENLETGSSVCVARVTDVVLPKITVLTGIWLTVKPEVLYFVTDGIRDFEHLADFVGESNVQVGLCGAKRNRTVLLG
ncbi:hypothetical protein DGG96_17350 [Legionella qingyii]|uniref:Uncharacterized protein n=1 Tax=Legionella qingyii TaxID=2184757 RepID=A0A317TXS1_9GAMM|nr:hypothetical protein [Legionella qingyii]PWY54374.1 hypothetical protein DGG96_17350 [Legionella qingyii]